MKNLSNIKYIKQGIKGLICLCMIIFFVQNILIGEKTQYYNYKEFTYKRDYKQLDSKELENETNVSQTFISKGNILNNISIYFGEIKNQDLVITIRDKNNNIVNETKIKLLDYKDNSWNYIALDCKGIKFNQEYIMDITSVQDLSGVYICSGAESGNLGSCKINDEVVQGGLAIGFDFTYKYMTIGNGFELVMVQLLSLVMLIALCYSVCKIEVLYKSFCKTVNKKGLWYAIYFSASCVLLYNPLEQFHNEVIEFKRIIGAGINANVDVSRRISNFNTWFIMFAISFCLLYLLFNHIFQTKTVTENKKIIKFMDDVIVLGNCLLVLKSITFFYNESNGGNTYLFINWIVMLLILILIAYILFDLQKNISAVEFAKLLIVGGAISYPLSIFIGFEGEMDKVFAGALTIVYIIVVVFCKFCKRIINSRIYKYVSTASVIIFSMLPLMTSVYIELIHVLNQYSIFIAHPAKYYFIANILVLGVCIICIVFFTKKNIDIINWKKWAYPFLIVGITCLSIQIPLQAIYNPDVFEGANYSILISDFLNYGSVPVVEHYGGHMMTGVWEGILYGLINNDYMGAVVSPYSNLIIVLLCLLFFYFVKNVWNENIALVVTLCFPFYDYWSYFGLGMLVCLAIAGYVKKNTYTRAVLVWLAFIWCALYRLDLGFAFGVAAIVSLVIYIVSTKSWHAIKQLGITLFGCAGVGISCWSVICLIKGINPIYRLLEFVMLSLSNQNWAYASIGNNEKTVFGVFYVIMPFVVALCLLFSIFSKEMKENIKDEERIVLMILGFSFFVNYSRGLVRHSLYEMYTDILIWTAYIFMAYFISCFKKNRKIFVPVFLLFMLMNTLFVQDENYISKSIVDNSVIQPEKIVESWTKTRFDDESVQTYWEVIKSKRTVVERVKLTSYLNDSVYRYETVLGKLLGRDETYIDFVNKTLLYSLLEKKNPVYVSQSPLQLSGEFTQEQFVRQMKGIPLVIMPIDPNGYRASNSLDDISNLYRNYIVSEYIYKNYVPLCKYGDIYAVWCLEHKYYEYKKMVEELTHCNEYVDDLFLNDGLKLNNVKIESDIEGSVSIIADGIDPMLMELQNLIDISSYIGGEMKIKVEYTSDIAGDMQLFYTSDEGENYNGEKVKTIKISDSGVAEFVIPITQYTRIRLDIPEGSKVVLTSLSTKSLVDIIDYGYDGPYENIDIDDAVSYSYSKDLHSYKLNHLPRIWASYDSKEANKGNVVAEAIYKDGIYCFDNKSIRLGENGNYLKLTATYNGLDKNGLYENNDEYSRIDVVLGNYEDGNFIEKCKYNFNIKEGTYDYLIRVSADYYWYIGEINAIRIQAEDILFDVDIQILEE